MSVLVIFRCVLPPGESRSVCAARPIKARKRMEQTERQTDGRRIVVTLRLPLDAASLIISWSTGTSIRLSHAVSRQQNNASETNGKI